MTNSSSCRHPRTRGCSRTSRSSRSHLGQRGKSRQSNGRWKWSSPRFRTDERNLFDRLTSNRASSRIPTVQPCEARVNLASESGHHLRNSNNASPTQLDSRDLALVWIQRKPLRSTRNLNMDQSSSSPYLLSRLTRQEDSVPTLESRWICCILRIPPANTGGSTRWTIVSSHPGLQALLDSIQVFLNSKACWTADMANLTVSVWIWGRMEIQNIAVPILMLGSFINP